MPHRFHHIMFGAYEMYVRSHKILIARLELPMIVQGGHFQMCLGLV